MTRTREVNGVDFKTGWHDANETALKVKQRDDRKIGGVASTTVIFEDNEPDLDRIRRQFG